MGQYDFSYEVPDNFNKRVIQFLNQSGGTSAADAFRRCKYDYTVLDFAYYERMKGDTWNKKAVDFTIEGPAGDISVLRSNDQNLKKAIEMALKPNESGFLVKKIYYFEDDELLNETCLPGSNEERLDIDISIANRVLDDLLAIGGRICTNHSYNASTPENTINDAVRDMLSTKGYSEVKDQTRHGVSDTGKDAARLDLLLTKDGKEIAIYEALRLSRLDKSKIKEHIDKSITNYNALGTPTFVAVYYNSQDFGPFWNGYYEHIKEYDYPFQIKNPIQELSHPNASTRVATMILSKDGYDFPVYFIAFKIV